KSIERDASPVISLFGFRPNVDVLYLNSKNGMLACFFASVWQRRCKGSGGDDYEVMLTAIIYTTYCVGDTTTFYITRIILYFCSTMELPWFAILINCFLTILFYFFSVLCCSVAYLHLYLTQKDNTIHVIPLHTTFSLLIYLSIHFVNFFSLC